MADIELRDRFFGAGMVGTIDVDGPTREDVDRLRYAFVDAAARTARELSGIGASLETLNWSVESLAKSIWNMEASLGSRLDAQTAYLADQVRALASIDQALRSPAKIRAAERMADAAG